MLFEAEMFRQYILGKLMKVEMDHKPLEAIFRKPMLTAPKRLQRVLLQLLKFQMNVHYRKGTESYLADFLSKSPLLKISNNKSDRNNLEKIKPA